MSDRTVKIVERVSLWGLAIMSPFAAIAIGGTIYNLLTRGALTAYMRHKGYA